MKKVIKQTTEYNTKFNQNNKQNYILGIITHIGTFFDTCIFEQTLTN